MVLLLDYLMIPFFAVFALVTSIEDVRCSTIRNKWILSAMLYVSATLFCQIVYFLVTGAAFNWSYFSSLAISAFFAGLVGIAAWLANLWTAADAKLLFAYALIVPPHWYTRALFPLFPSFSILFNAVLPLAAFYCLVMLWNMIRGPQAPQLRTILLENLNPRKHAELLIFLFGFSWFVGWLLGSALEEPGFLILIATMVILYWLARRFIPKLLIPLSIAACAARLIIDMESVLTLGFIQGFVQMYLIIAIVFVLLLNTSSSALSEAIAISRLKPGMILAQDVRPLVGKAAVIHEKGRRRFLFAERSEGLTQEEIALLKKLRKQKKLEVKELRISHGIPFAPFMALGAMLAALIGGNVLLLI